MTVATANSFVLFPMGPKRFALAADQVAELAQPDRLQTFPHTTPLLIGVLVRRGQVIPVCDVAQILIGPNAPARKFYLIARRSVSRAGTTTRDYIAIPVAGECELVNGTVQRRPDDAPEYVSALLAIGSYTFEVIDMEKLIVGKALSAEQSRGCAVEVGP